jgi:hypothetical protein
MVSSSLGFIAHTRCLYLIGQCRAQVFGLGYAYSAV